MQTDRSDKMVVVDVKWEEKPGGSKYSRAQELGIPMVDEEELRRMVEV